MEVTELVDGLLTGLSALTPVTLLIMFAGVILGTIFGSMPGLTGAAGMTILLPVTFSLEPGTSVLLLMAIWISAVWAGAVPAIMVNIPGTAAAAATSIEGYPMARNGQGALALRASIVGSVIGSIVSLLALVFLSPPLAAAALQFGPAEMLAFAIFGLSIVVSLSARSVLKGLVSVFIGLLLATIGVAPSGGSRFVFMPELHDGLPIITTLIGLFTIPEVLLTLEERRSRVRIEGSIATGESRFLLRGADWVKHSPNIARSSLIGTLVGILPGAGPTVSGFITYNEARRLGAKDEVPFGKGNVRGVIASDTGNNAAVASSLVPALTLGIPGSVDAVIIIAALQMHGVLVGPRLFENENLVYGIFVGIFVAIVMMLFVGWFGSRYIAKVASIRYSLLAPVILVFALIGVYAVRNSPFDVVLALAVGLLGFLLRKIGISVVPLVLGLVLGEIVETNIVQAVGHYGSLPAAIAERPLSWPFLALAVVSVVFPLVRSWRARRSGPSSDPRSH